MSPHGLRLPLQRESAPAAGLLRGKHPESEAELLGGMLETQNGDGCLEHCFCGWFLTVLEAQ